jgi:glycosyltransferase involved in cell wall biosynthesis
VSAHPPVTFVASHSELGGQESNLMRLLQQLPAESIRGVVALHDGPALPRLAALGHDTWLVPTPARLGILLAAMKLRRVLQASGAELIHADGAKAAVCCALAMTGKPIVWMKHDTSFDGPVARAIGARCTAVAGVSPTVTATFHRANVHVVPNGVPEYDIDRGEARRELLALIGAPDDAELVVQVGRVVPAKGQLDTVEAAARLDRPSLWVVIVGAPDRHAGQYAQELRSRAGARVVLLGFRDDAPRLMAGADLVVMPSRSKYGPYGWGEGFGLAAAEAMAVGTPVLAYSGGALRDTLDGAGAFVPAGDIAAYARELGALLDDPARRARMTEAGRRLAATFSIDAAVERLRDVYRLASSSNGLR